MSIEIRKSRGRGRGVFATKRIKRGTVIESCPVLLFEQKTSRHMLQEFAFRWDKNHVALALGWGSLYNHSYTPNAACDQRKRQQCIDIIALRNIEVGEEITFNYNGAPDDDSPLWFTVK